MPSDNKRLKLYFILSMVFLAILAIGGLIFPLIWLNYAYILASFLILIALYYFQSKLFWGLAQIEALLHQIVGGNMPDIPDFASPWTLIGKRIKAITTYLTVMRQSMEDRIALLEERNRELKDQEFRTKEAYLALEHSNIIQSELRGLLDMDEIINHTLRLLVSELSANKGFYLRYDLEEQKPQVLSPIGVKIQAGHFLNPTEMVGYLGQLEEKKQNILTLAVPEGETGSIYGIDYTAGLLARIVVDKELWGCICIFDKEIRGGKTTGFTEKDSVILENVASNLEKDLKSAHLFELATIDGLSKIYVRRYFEKRLEEEIKRSRRYKTPFSLLLLDIDHFKGFNDTYGHLVGDEVIYLVAHKLKEEVRNGVDVVARYGGEEMIILLPQTPLDQSIIVAERIRKAIEQMDIPSLNNAKHTPTVTASIGISSFPEHGDDLKTLISCADQALYIAKNNGRNQVHSLNQTEVKLSVSVESET